MVDTALVLCLADVLDRVEDELASRRPLLLAWPVVGHHRATVMSGRTLTQHAVPITFGLKAATWLSGLSDAAEALRADAYVPARTDRRRGRHPGGGRRSGPAPAVSAIP